MTEQTPATPPAVWAAALADGSGRHVAVRNHWPELAAALDAALDGPAGAVPDTLRERVTDHLGVDSEASDDEIAARIGYLRGIEAAAASGAVPDTGHQAGFLDAAKQVAALWRAPYPPHGAIDQVRAKTWDWHELREALDALAASASPSGDTGQGDESGADR